MERKIIDKTQKPTQKNKKEKITTKKMHKDTKTNKTAKKNLTKHKY